MLDNAQICKLFMKIARINIGLFSFTFTHKTFLLQNVYLIFASILLLKDRKEKNKYQFTRSFNDSYNDTAV